jgi:hypothetical protein
VEARYKYAGELPPMECRVVLTLANGVEFWGCRIWVECDEGGTWAWATADEYEPCAPECWDDGVCWGMNGAGVPSEQPVSWRYG